MKFGQLLILALALAVVVSLRPVSVAVSDVIAPPTVDERILDYYEGAAFSERDESTSDRRLLYLFGIIFILASLVGSLLAIAAVMGKLDKATKFLKQWNTRNSRKPPPRVVSPSNPMLPEPARVEVAEGANGDILRLSSFASENEWLV